ncbi:hypothetical protein J3R83DRAFT_10846, partial [Lanmaoa asiatica]
VATITSAAEMKKPHARRTAKGAEFSFSLKEPWDTLLAQILSKISAALNPEVIAFDDYEITYFIPRVLPKPM